MGDHFQWATWGPTWLCTAKPKTFILVTVKELFVTIGFTYMYMYVRKRDYLTVLCTIILLYCVVFSIIILEISSRQMQSTYKNISKYSSIS